MEANGDGVEDTAGDDVEVDEGDDVEVDVGVEMDVDVEGNGASLRGGTGRLASEVDTSKGVVGNADGEDEGGVDDCCVTGDEAGVVRDAMVVSWTAVDNTEGIFVDVIFVVERVADGDDGVVSDDRLAVGAMAGEEDADVGIDDEEKVDKEEPLDAADDASILNPASPIAAELAASAEDSVIGAEGIEDDEEEEEEGWRMADADGEDGLDRAGRVPAWSEVMRGEDDGNNESEGGARGVDNEEEADDAGRCIWPGDSDHPLMSRSEEAERSPLPSEADSACIMGVDEVGAGMGEGLILNEFGLWMPCPAMGWPDGESVEERVGGTNSAMEEDAVGGGGAEEARP